MRQQSCNHQKLVTAAISSKKSLDKKFENYLAQLYHKNVLLYIRKKSVVVVTRRLPTLQLSITSLFIPFMSKDFRVHPAVTRSRGTEKVLPLSEPTLFLSRFLQILILPASQ